MVPPATAAAQSPNDQRMHRHQRCTVSRVLLIMLVLATATIGVVVTYGGTGQIARASNIVSETLRQRIAPTRAVQIARGQAGEFSLQAKINGVNAPMVIDTGATSVVLSWETAKAAGLPLELLEYDVDVETAGATPRRRA